ncbi:MAG TPA: hypothetical protein VJZ68_02145 [Nitrososphaera sp.]|nr:hypothetical protein [Nitrososphaera sp.]
MKKLIAAQVPKDIQQNQLKAIIILGLLDLFDDPNIEKREAKRVIERILKSIQGLSERVLVITSIQEGKYANLVASSFEKHITLNKTRNNRLSVTLNKKPSVTLTERELKIINQR